MVFSNKTPCFLIGCLFITTNRIYELRIGTNVRMGNYFHCAEPGKPSINALAPGGSTTHRPLGLALPACGGTSAGRPDARVRTKR